MTDAVDAAKILRREKEQLWADADQSGSAVYGLTAVA